MTEIIYPWDKGKSLIDLYIDYNSGHNILEFC